MRKLATPNSFSFSSLHDNNNYKNFKRNLSSLQNFNHTNHLNRFSKIINLQPTRKNFATQNTISTNATNLKQNSLWHSQIRSFTTEKDALDEFLQEEKTNKSKAPTHIEYNPEDAAVDLGRIHQKLIKDIEKRRVKSSVRKLRELVTFGGRPELKDFEAIMDIAYQQSRLHFVGMVMNIMDLFYPDVHPKYYFQSVISYVTARNESKTIKFINKLRAAVRQKEYADCGITGEWSEIEEEMKEKHVRYSSNFLRKVQDELKTTEESEEEDTDDVPDISKPWNPQEYERQIELSIKMHMNPSVTVPKGSDPIEFYALEFRRSRSLLNSIKLLQHFEEHYPDRKVDTKLLNSVLQSFVSLTHNSKDVLNAYQLFEKYNTQPDVNTFNILIEFFRSIGQPSNAEAVFRSGDRLGLYRESDTSIPNQHYKEAMYSLMRGYAVAQEAASSFRIFDELVSNRVTPDSNGYNALMRALAEQGDLRAFKLFQFMEENDDTAPTLDTFNELIRLCVVHHKPNKARSFITQMDHRGIVPNVVTHTLLFDHYYKSKWQSRLN